MAQKTMSRLAVPAGIASAIRGAFSDIPEVKAVYLHGIVDMDGRGREISPPGYHFEIYWDGADETRQRVWGAEKGLKSRFPELYFVKRRVSWLEGPAELKERLKRSVKDSERTLVYEAW